MDIAGSDAGAGARTVHAEADAPGWFQTYALTYAFGIVWLAVAMLLLGTQKPFGFDPSYDALLTLPPLVTAGCALLVDHRGSWKTLPLRALLLAVVCGIVSALSTVPLTPLLVLMFRGGVTGNLSATGVVSTIALLVVASPLVVMLIANLRRGRFGRALVLLAGLGVAGVALVMAISPSGPLASSLRLDQAEITMITASWWLPFYAATAAFARRWGLA